MNRILSLIFLLGGCVLADSTELSTPGTAGGQAVASKQDASAPGDLAFQEKQWKIPPVFFECCGVDSSQPIDAREALMKVGFRFPEGTSAQYSLQKKVLTVRNTAEQIRLLDVFLSDLREEWQKTTEDFRRWSDEEFSRRQAALAGLKRVKDKKSAKKCYEMILKNYKVTLKSLAEDPPLGDLSVAYEKSSALLDRKTLGAVGKKFSKQIKQIYKEQGRLMDMVENQDNPDEAFQALIRYTEVVYMLAKRDGKGRFLEVTVDGVVRKRARDE